MPRPIFEVHSLGVAVNDLEAARRRPHQELMIEPYGPVLPFGWVDAIVDVSFSVYPGEVLAIVGESGSGKTLSVLGSLACWAQGPK